MAVERKLFIATTANEVQNVVDFCAYLGPLVEGYMYHDYTSENHDLWYINPEELDDKEREKLQNWGVAIPGN